MVGQRLPDDDLYARLELTPDASPEAVELAWRSLLKIHHPDVAGDDAALERAKRINVAHDWLSDPTLRERYDRERHAGIRRGGVRRAGYRPRDGAPAPVSTYRPRSPRIFDAEPPLRIRRFLERVGRLTADELDRLALADRAPIAFLATLQRFGPPDGPDRLAAIEAELERRVPNGRWSDLPTRDALVGVAAEIIWGAFLDEHLVEPFRLRARERLLRGWETAIDQPRYGPNGAAVEAVVARVGRLTQNEATAILKAAKGEVSGSRPWPPGSDPDEDHGLRVSAELASRDVAAAVPAGATGGLAPTNAVRLRRLLGRVGHALVLRHLFPERDFADLVAPWRKGLREPLPGDRGAPAARVRRTPG